ncbi:hypothetical protein O6H91_07G132400 [Diphasiastrum complanatum]|uniref:Uncharacterized protein n=1 Tax=Diphasiastrum complanatum TaxID=34168 RepID=A0ACC2DAD1_DIPCM|nr:hypothetical protein O6H91_07G132400 [Diphasiastrum complanatum]
MLRPEVSRLNWRKSSLIAATHLSSSKNTASPFQMGSMARNASTSVRIAIVGDVHDVWDPVKDEKALQYIKPDLLLFTGDFGDENVELVKDVSRLNFPKAVILGNHDSWWTSGPFRRYKVNADGGPVGVRMQLEALGESHVGYSRLDFPSLGLSVVGGRPFSSGGKRIWSQELLADIYGVTDLKTSAERIIEHASTAPIGHSLIFLCHNGPTGLGSRCQDICGRDWVLAGGDHGDSDLQEALNSVQKIHGRKIPLVVFGHMHKSLQMGLGERTMLVSGTDGIIYLNGAVVPRVKRGVIFDSSSKVRNSQFHDKGSVKGYSSSLKRHFTVVDLVDNAVAKIVENWVSVAENTCQGAETILYMREGVDL